MKTNELAKWCIDHPNIEIFIARQQLDDNGDAIESSYHELSFEVWDDTSSDSHYIIYPGELVSG